MCIAFGKEPPVYARPPDYQPTPSHPLHSSTEYHGEQISNNNTGNSVQSDHHISQNNTGERQPPLPPKPPKPPIPSQLQLQPPQYAPSPKPSYQQLLVSRQTQQQSSKTPDFMDQHDELSVTIESQQATLPPKLPPNPQKLEALEKVRSAMSDIDTRIEQPMRKKNETWLKQNFDSLKAMENTAIKERTELERIITVAKENESLLKNKIQRVKEVLIDIENRPEINVDEIVCAETVVHNQLYDLVTDDFAIEDTIYVLSKALENDKISLNEFMKVREVSVYETAVLLT